jgi:CelD/BcsL family acetyltransferase involved in cellulose biosynthesis
VARSEEDWLLPAGGTTTVVRGRGPLAAHAGELDDLLDRTDAPLAARWPSLDTWLRHHPLDEPWAVLVRRDTRPGGGPAGGGELVGAATLARQLRLGCWKIGPIGVEGEPAHLAATDPPAATALAGAIRGALGRLNRPWFLRLTDLPDEDPVAAALSAELPVSACRPGPEAPQLRFAPGQPLSTYLSRNTRAAAAKARNRIARDRLVQDIAWTADPDQVAAVLPEVIEVHRRRSVQVHGHSALEDPTARDFFDAVVRGHAAAGDVRLQTVRLNGDLAAFALCLLDRDTLWVYANMVSPDWLRYSAGTISNAEVVRWAYATPGVAAVDWGAGLQRYKLSGAVTLRRSQQVQAWSSRGLRLGVAGRDLAGRWRRRAGRPDSGPGDAPVSPASAGAAG